MARSKTATASPYDLKKVDAYKVWMIQNGLLQEIIGDNIKMYGEMGKRVSYMSCHQAEYIDMILNKHEDLRRFLIMHSAFNINDIRSDNIIIKHMIKALQPSESDMDYFHNKHTTDDPFINKIMEEFNGEIIRYELYPIFIVYGNSYDPVEIFDVDFERFAEEKIAKINRHKSMEILEL